MLDRLGLPRPQIATKLYGAIALSLAVVYLLAAAIIQFAGRTEEAVGWIREDLHVHPVLLLPGVVRSIGSTVPSRITYASFRTLVIACSSVGARAARRSTASRMYR